MTRTWAKFKNRAQAVRSTRPAGGDRSRTGLGRARASLRLPLAVIALCLTLLFPQITHAACSSPAGEGGVFYYNTDRAALQYCDGENWVMAGLGSYAPVAVDFDGTSEMLKSALTGLSDDKKFTASFWVKPPAEVASFQVVLTNTDSDFIIALDNGASNVDGFWTVYITSSGPVAIQDYESDDVLEAEKWNHVLISVDVGNSQADVYINGAADTPISTPTFNTGNSFDFTVTNYVVGGFEFGGGEFSGSLADLWIDIGTYIDLSDASMREKFLSTNNMPMYLGADGSLPTGEAPEIFLSGDVADWHTNKGTAGGFTENGTLTAGEKIPLTAAPDLTTGLLGHWKLDETSGTTANDSSGNAFNGSMANGLSATNNSVSGVLTNALDMDGTDDFVTVPYNAAFDNLNDITITTWLRRDNTDNVLDPIFAKTNSSLVFGFCDASSGVCNASNNNKLIVYSNVTTPSLATSAGAINDTDWHFVAVTRNGDTVTFYIDGVASGSSTMSNSFGTDGLGFRIGSNINALLHFDGKLDDVRLYNRALSAGEIAALYAGTCSSPSGAGGTIIYNTDHKVMQYCNGVEWVAMSKIGGTGGGGCSSPAGVAGEVVYSSVDEVMQYCNSEDWVIIGKPAPPASGLVAHYRMDETSGTNVENANNPGTHDGTFSGNANVVSASGKVATALTFDGTDDVVTVTAPAGLADLGPGSWAFWVYRNSLADGALLYKSDNNTDEGWWIDFDSGFGGIGFTAVHSSGNLRRYNSAPGTGEWFHVVITWDGGSASTSAEVYINGEITAIDGTDDNGSGTHASDSTRDMLIGDGGTGSTENFDGRLDDIRIYNRVLSAEEVKQLYHATR